MRLTSTFLLASFLIGSAACAANGTSSGGSPSEGGKQQPGENTPGTNEENKPPPEKPLTAKQVCETVPMDVDFGRGCSGTGYGQEVCAFEDTYGYCGSNKCVYDSRKGDKSEFFCAPKCNAADTSVLCPLGYECIAPTASCAGDAEEGVCTKRVDFACEDVGDTSGTLVEGLNGTLLSVKWTGSQGSLRQKTASSWKTLTTWTDTTSYGSIYGVARTDTKLLILTANFEIVVEGTTAKATRRPTGTTTSYAPVVGVSKDGSFISLELANDTYATLRKRGTDGKWTEVGPTRKRIASLNVLGKGFIARCEDELCASTDGENFETIALPDDVAIGESSRFTAAGQSNEDFYFAVEGRLFHYRKGKWVEEGPRGEPYGSSSYNDMLKVSSTGAVAYFTYSGSKYTTFTTTAGGECWKTTTADNLNSAILVGDSFKYTSYSYGDLCTLNIE